MAQHPENETDEQGAVAEEVRDEVRAPKQYAVLLLNDHYTTMEFVIEVLTSIFRHSQDQAQAVMLAVHHSGKGVAGVYRLEIAETKVMQVHERARSRGFPLRCAIEPVEGPAEGGES